jgi:hypothetical protein
MIAEVRACSCQPPTSGLPHQPDISRERRSPAPRRDAGAARRFFQRAIGATKVTPAEVTTDQARLYPAVLDELLPAAWHRTDRYANNRVECDHGRLKARL